MIRAVEGNDEVVPRVNASEYLRTVGKRVLAPYCKLPGAACAVITGSSAEGLSDFHSDLDMIVYYDAFPPEEAMRALRATLTAAPLQWSLGSYAEEEFIESFRVEGIECQIVHTTVAQWERQMRETLAGKEPGGPLHKAMSGTLAAIPVHGAERLERWKALLRDYPEELRIAMVRQHLKFFALWGVNDRLEIRDSELWFRQSLLESSFNLIGVCAGLSKRYFSTFQFKRGGRFYETLTVAPRDFARRLEGLWHVPRRQAVRDLRDLVAETVELVERELPHDADRQRGVDTSACRTALARNDPPWEPA